MSNTTRNMCFMCGKIHENNNPFCEGFINSHNDALRDRKPLAIILDEAPVKCGSIFDNSQSFLSMAANYIVLSTPTSTD